MYSWNERQGQWHVSFEYRLEGERIRWFRRVPKSIGRDQEPVVREMAERFAIEAKATRPGLIRERQEERRAKAKAENVGYIYAFESDAHPGLLKVGKTRGDPVRRAREMGTGCPFPFRVALAERVEWVDRAERVVHGHLKSQRVNAAREFFRVSADEVRAAVNAYRELIAD